jgi:micrococcal nuclease
MRMAVSPLDDRERYEVPPPELYWYRAKCVNVVDGDTMDLVFDLGFRVSAHHRVRLLGVDTPEMRGPERERGLAVKYWVIDWMDYQHSLSEWPLLVRSEKSDSFGRYLAEIFPRFEGASLSDQLLEGGLAVPYRK